MGSSPDPRGTLPHEYCEFAANMAMHFPDVLVALGAPDLDDHFLPGARTHFADGPQGRALEVVLQRRPLSPLVPESRAMESVQVPAPLPPHQQGIFDRLDQLARDFEDLSFALEAVTPTASLPTAPMRMERPSSPPIAEHNGRDCAIIDGLADDFHALARELHMAQVCPATCSEVQDHLASGLVQQQGPTALVFAPPPRACPASPLVAAHAGKGDAPAVGHGSVAAVHQRCVPTAPESAAKNLTPKSARSSRGGQARQGAIEGHAGRSRTLPAKVLAFRNQRQDQLSISIHKLQQLDSEPMSPKFVAGDSSKVNVWGRKRHARSASPHEDRSADAITARIERKLMQMFGVQGNDKSIGLCKRYKSID